MKVAEEFTHFMWCSIGFIPEDAANGVCKKFWCYPFGCCNCPDWKLLPVEEIISRNKHRKRIIVARVSEEE